MLQFGAVDTIELHPGYVLVAALLVGIQAAMIVALLVSRARRRMTEARNSAMLRAIPDLMFLQTRDGVYLDYSAPEPQTLLVPPESFLGKNMRDILPPQLADRLAEAVARLFAGEEPVILEYPLQLPTGAVGRYEARLVRCGSDKFLSIVRDITERTRAADELATAQAEVLRVSKLATLGEFAGSIVHEMSQPLTAIIANAHACRVMVDRENVNAAAVREGLDDVVAAGESAREVVEHARQLFGRGGRTRESLDLRNVVNEACMLVAPTLAIGRITLERHTDDTLPAIRGDRVQLRQVVLNLVSNGIQAMERVDGERRLTIRTDRDGDGMLRLTVSDTGVGLDEIDPSQLFSASYTTKPNGMGWGLSISRLIVEAHGGMLTAAANEGGGASFAFTVPIEARAAHWNEPNAEHQTTLIT
jgi:C4-dicarboxylate-specific signal transduction histidine kinase